MKNFISLFLFGLLFALTCSATPPQNGCIENEQFSDIGAPPTNYVFNIPGTDATHFLPGADAENFNTPGTDAENYNTNIEGITDLDLQAHSSSAEVRQVNGLYIFLYSTPTGQTEFLGTVDSPLIVASKDMDNMVKLMSKRAKEKFPQAEAIIFSNNELWSCEVVRFKQ